MVLAKSIKSTGGSNVVGIRQLACLIKREGMFIKTSILVMKDLNSLVAFFHTWDSIWHTENTRKVFVTILALKFN